MLQSIDLKNLPAEVNKLFFQYINSVQSALELSDCSKRYADFLQGVTTGEKLAQHLLDVRASLGGEIKDLDQIISVPYFTEDKLRTLIGVFYVEAGIWKLPSEVEDPNIIRDQKSPEVVITPEIADDPEMHNHPEIVSESKDGRIIPNPGEPLGPVTKVGVNIRVLGGPRPGKVAVTVKKGAEFAIVSSVGPSRIPGDWRVVLAVSDDVNKNPIVLRVDLFDASKFFVLGVNYVLPELGGEIIIRY